MNTVIFPSIAYTETWAALKGQEQTLSAAPRSKERSILNFTPKEQEMKMKKERE